MSRSLQKWLKYVLTISLAALPLAESAAYAACQDKIIDACQGANNAVDTQKYNEMALDSRGTRSGVQNHANSLNHAATNRSVAAGNCEDAAKQCKDRCSSKAEIQKCEAAVKDQANQMKQQSAAEGGGGGDMGMIAGLLGAAAGVAAAMIAQKKNEKPPPPPQPVATGALQLNGSLNCQMQDSYQYAECATFLSNFCASQATSASAAAAAGTTAAPPGTGTIIGMPNGALPPTPDCATFNSQYCSTSVTPPQAWGMQRTDGAVTQVNYAGTGAGLGTDYCARTVSANWCATPGRSMCPSCQQQDVYTSSACAANPALCLTQTAPQQIQTATTNPACVGDPLYTPGSPYAIAGTGTAASGTGLPAGVVPVAVTGGTTGGIAVPVAGGVGVPATGGNGLPVAILPTSVSSKGMGVASVGKGGVREGQAPGGGGNSAGGGSFSGTALKTGSANAHANAKELIAAGGVIVAGNPSAPSRGPASDVVPQFGPSLFTTSSAVIRQHCESGKLNCP